MVPLSSKKTQSWRKLWEKAPNFPGGKLFSSLPSPGPEDFSVSNILLTERSQVAVWQLRRYDGDTAGWWSLQSAGCCRDIGGVQCTAARPGCCCCLSASECEMRGGNLTSSNPQSGVWSQESHHSPSPPRPRPAGPIRRSRVRRSRSC